MLVLLRLEFCCVADVMRVDVVVDDVVIVMIPMVAMIVIVVERLGYWHGVCGTL